MTGRRFSLGGQRMSNAVSSAGPACPDSGDAGLLASDPALLNHMAWRGRWRDRRASTKNALAVLEIAKQSALPTRAVEKGRALRTLAWQAKWRGDFDEAMELALQAEGLLPEADHPVQRADLYSIIGVVHYSRHRIDLATCATDRGLRIVEAIGGAAVEARLDLLTTKATLQRYTGQIARAAVTLGAALDIAEGPERARVEHNVARCVMDDDALDEALSHGLMSVDLCQAFRNRVVLPYAHEVVGACLVRMDRYDEADRHLSDGLQVAMADGDRRVQCQILHQHGALEMRRARVLRALDLYRHGTSIAERMGYLLWQERFARDIADVYEKIGDARSALAAHKQAWALRDSRRA